MDRDSVVGALNRTIQTLSEVRDIIMSETKIDDGFRPPYVVRRGDTLTGIAKGYGVQEELLLRINPHIKFPTGIRVNQVIQLPVIYRWPYCDACQNRRTMIHKGVPQPCAVCYQNSSIEEETS